MPPKRTMNKSGSQVSADENKRLKPTESSVHLKTNLPSQDVEEKMYLLQREKSLLLSKLKVAKKNLSDMRGTLQELEFKHLQDPQKKEEKFLELFKNVEMWSKTVGMTIDEAIYLKEDSRQWHLKGTVDQELHFNINVSCATDDLTKKGYVKSFSIECSDPCKNELQQWFTNNEGNIEQTFKVLKAYSEKNKDRISGLEDCRKEFDSLITISKEDSGETVVELGTEDAYYFQIKWKLAPSSKHYARVKNVCRIACTKDGDEYIRAHTDLSSIKKRLSQSPIEVIQLLARGIANEKKSGNSVIATRSNTDTAER